MIHKYTAGLASINVAWLGSHRPEPVVLPGERPGESLDPAISSGIEHENGSNPLGIWIFPDQRNRLISSYGFDHPMITQYSIHIHTLFSYSYPWFSGKFPILPKSWYFNPFHLPFDGDLVEVVLMSRYSAGTIKAALDRVAAVVFASVVGAMATRRAMVGFA